jgi:DNA-binding transcriptional ArsR family regulator
LPRRASAAAKLPRPEDSAPLFAALGDETRLRLVSSLCKHGPMSIARLTDGADVTRQAITKHLRVMEDAGLVYETRHGRESVWELEVRRLERARRCLDVISQQWDDVLCRLKKIVEE